MKQRGLLISFRSNLEMAVRQTCAHFQMKFITVICNMRNLMTNKFGSKLLRMMIFWRSQSTLGVRFHVCWQRRRGGGDLGFDHIGRISIEKTSFNLERIKHYCSTYQLYFCLTLHIGTHNHFSFCRADLPRDEKLTQRPGHRTIQGALSDRIQRRRADSSASFSPKPPSSSHNQN
jgi:hypothetical protein